MPSRRQTPPTSPQPPTPPARVAETVARAESLVKADKFAEAVVLLEARQKELGQTLADDEKRALQIALADAHFYWGRSAWTKRNAGQEAILHYQTAYEIDKVYRPGDSANDLSNIGFVHSSLGERAKALEFYNRALPIQRAVGDRSGEATTLNNIGNVYSSLGENAKALEFLNRALPILQAIGNKAGEAATLVGIGAVYSSLGEKAKALEFYNRALPILRAVGDRSGEATTLDNLMWVWADRKNAARNPGVAALYGKQAINVLQRLRRNIRALDTSLQQSFLKSVSDTYQRLADILIAQGRIGEAQQVLGLLKVRELDDFTRRDASQARVLDNQTDLTPDEKRAYAEYTRLSETLAALGREFEALDKLVERDPAQKARYSALQKQLADATAAFIAYLNRLPSFFPPRADGRPEVAMVTSTARQFAATLRQLGQDTNQRVVAVYALMAETRLHLIVVTPTTSIARSVAIDDTALYGKINAFQQALRSPKFDVKPLAAELYDLLVRPIEGDLAGAKAQTVMWSLDGALRYIPLAALYDKRTGKYLIQKFPAPLFTPASLTSLERASKGRPRVLALGVSRESTVDGLTFDALKGAKAEVEAIQKLLPGSVSLLDGAFRKETFFSSLKRGYPLVHLATHFHLNPALANASFLLLGNNEALRLDELDRMPGTPFFGVELLALSACETGLGGGVPRRQPDGSFKAPDGAGREVESLAVIAQNQGAGAVLASLWPVADASTAALMGEFYRVRRARPALTKAECLRLAQVALLEGKVAIDPTSLRREARVSRQGNRPPGDARGPVSGTPVPSPTPAGGALKPFVAPKNAPASHPFYWAPFVLIGNWK